MARGRVSARDRRLVAGSDIARLAARNDRRLVALLQRGGLA